MAVPATAMMGVRVRKAMFTQSFFDADMCAA